LRTIVLPVFVFVKLRISLPVIRPVVDPSGVLSGLDDVLLGVDYPDVDREAAVRRNVERRRVDWNPTTRGISRQRPG
jgi:hypothetical protein